MNVQAPIASRAAIAVAARSVRSRHAGTGLIRRSSVKISDAVEGRRANEPSGSGCRARARSMAGPRSPRWRTTSARPKRSRAALLARTCP